MKEQSFNTSLVITTYNWPEALRVCLESVARQSVMPDEVIIADDGSTDDTRQVINACRASSGFNTKHVWHEDMGFRKSAILNKALAMIDPHNFVILADGDLLLHKHFVKDHVRLAEPGYYTFGRRVYLSETVTHEVLASRIGEPGIWQSGIKHRTNMLHLPLLSPITKRYRRGRPYGQGCNLAAWQQDILRVNGFDEDYEGWGYEDTDFICRLRNSGLVSKAAKYQAIVYHLFHPTRPVGNTNLERLNQTQRNHSRMCRNGIKKIN